MPPGERRPLPGRLFRRWRRADGSAVPDGAAPAAPRVAVVTDSTACLSAEERADSGIDVVALDVAAGGARYRDGEDLDPAALTELLASGERVTTSQPAPGAFVEAYERAARAGAVAVVSVHLSGALSGTVRTAGLAAQLAPLPVHVVDSGSTGLALGYAALAAARSLEQVPWWGEDSAAERAAAAAERVGRSTSAWFVVDSLDHLRRGGRISGAAAAFGTVLGLRPVLVLREGRIEVAERVRTRRAARERLEQLATADVAGRGGRAVVAVQHLRRADAAEDLAARVRAATGCEVRVREVGAVLGGHLGVGSLAVLVTDAWDEPSGGSAAGAAGASA